jgi:hypothetical protein
MEKKIRFFLTMVDESGNNMDEVELKFHLNEDLVNDLIHVKSDVVLQSLAVQIKDALFTEICEDLGKPFTKKIKLLFTSIKDYYK